MSLDYDQLSKLKHRNFLAGLVHLATGGLVILLYSIFEASQTRSSFRAYRNSVANQADSVPNADGLSCSTLDIFNTPGKCIVDIALTKPVEVVQVNLVYGAIAFFMITAFAHFFYATDGFNSGAYTIAIAQGWNPYRWLEYGCSASIMTILIGMSVGLRDFTALWALFFSTAAMMINGYCSESLLRGTAKVSQYARDAIYGSTAAGWLLFIGIWGAFIYTFSSLVSEVKSKFSGVIDPDTGKQVAVPSWVWFIVIIQLVYYALFGIVQIRHISSRFSGKAFSYVNTESAYITLSYTAKLALAAGIGYGLIFRTRDCPVEN